MPHECTTCGRTFADGSKEMLSGCPECGGTKFQFRPAGSDETAPEPSVADRPAPTADPTDREWPEHGDEPAHVGAGGRPDAAPPADQRDDADIIEADESLPEGNAQADARSGFAGPFELSADDGFEPADPEPPDADDADAEPPPDPSAPDADARSDAAPTGSLDSEPAPGGEREPDRPDLSELRQELNDQFESIRIVEPGQYELNLMELYDREEYVISLREDGKYVIEVPETWRDG